ncbi:GlxA family transcriptional regulator [Geomonas sp. Red69]|uniref:GlxA family transcriptional regulator n=1 Tax=Geomonas diazotrophica TaxID=2843197 RepID=UPI001C0F6F6A|nr:GlxA family transcriptional regulator [Geomonas diazotrophica]MBU5638169.1 GlxA family transcriptional regulator [Geomonas diazotrophica]
MNGTIIIAVAAYEGAELLDVTGPIEVFNMLNRCLAESEPQRPGYRIVILAEKAGPFCTCPGVRIVADHAWEDLPEQADTILVPGSPDDALERAMKEQRLLSWLAAQGPHARRLVSVCTGSLLLAEGGLLKGKRATTHWLDLDRLRNYPGVHVENDAIYTRDGKVATSAGVTAGMDLALALVEEDFGRKTALAVARRLVMFLKRPGGQAQFSTQLRAQMVEGGQLAPLLAWLRENPCDKATVEDLAQRAAMSPRNFARVFLRETGKTPAKYLDQLRLERSVALLEETTLPLERVARESGFTCAEQMRRAFVREMGVTPLAYRTRF